MIPRYRIGQHVEFASWRREAEANPGMTYTIVSVILGGQWVCYELAAYRTKAKVCTAPHHALELYQPEEV